MRSRGSRPLRDPFAMPTCPNVPPIATGWSPSMPRRFGSLSREEFYLVSMMSWFHMTVENTNLPIIRDLRAEGSTAEQVLFKIAQMVRLPANGLADHYFQVADSISAVLIAIDTGTLQQPGAARTFYDPTVPNQLSDAMNKIITHW